MNGRGSNSHLYLIKKEIKNDVIQPEDLASIDPCLSILIAIHSQYSLHILFLCPLCLYDVFKQGYSIAGFHGYTEMSPRTTQSNEVP